ncbi:MAG: hypothetical protein NT007_04685 [Candidatus Kapabacteria bacterium]|nr:hypothetical protein [Candidatus Kapabacteria bacterium]
MEKISIKNRVTQFIGIIILLISFEFALNSCERDLVIAPAPLKIDNSCDTVNVSFSKTVYPAISKCILCHNNSNSTRDVNLEGYENVRDLAIKGELFGSILSNMGMYIESECDKGKIQAWVKQGAKNN